MPTKKHPFNVLLDDNQVRALNQCANKTGLAKGLVLRYALTFYHSMVVADLPTCANGQRCFCPQMHAQAAHGANIHQEQLLSQPTAFPAPATPIHVPDEAVASGDPR